MLNPIQPVSPYQKSSKNSIHKNMIETQRTLNLIEQQNPNFLPFSLKQRHPHLLKSSQGSKYQQSKLEQSGLSQKLNKFQSRKIQINRNQSRSKFCQNQTDLKPQDTQSNAPLQLNSKTKSSAFQSNKQNQQNNQELFNTNPEPLQSNKLQVQVHLTIAKKKYTLKILNDITRYELEEVIQNFLIENQISSPAKKSHLKTKNLIIQMVQTKLNQSIVDKKNQQKINRSQFNNLNPQNNGFKQAQSYQQMIGQVNYSGLLQNQKKICEDGMKKTKNSRKFQKINPKQQIAPSYTSQHQSEEGCSPSFKQSFHLNKSPFENVSRFSPEPKHKNNKYEKLISDHFNDQVKQNMNSSFFEERTNQKILKKHCKSVMLAKKPTLEDNNFDQEIKFYKDKGSLQESTPKSVYQKWKQREKSKDQSKPVDKSFSNALKERKIPQNQHFNPKDNKQQVRIKEKKWDSKLSNKLQNENKWIAKINDRRADHELGNFKGGEPSNEIRSKSNRKIRGKEEAQKRSVSNKKRSRQDGLVQKNKILKREQKTPKKQMNKKQLHEKEQASKYTPYRSNQRSNQFCSISTPLDHNRIKNKQTNNQIHSKSKVYTVHDEQFRLQEAKNFQMSLDHFYKQGLVFEARKKQQLQEQFKSIYPFTTRRQEIIIKQNKNSKVQSREKQFSSKLASKSSSNILLDQKEKSALHEKLYKEDNKKKIKAVQIQAHENIFKINKTPTAQIQINLMEQNLKNIKGLSQNNKIKLIEKNIEIKQKIREKDKAIDEELSKMVIQGKVRPSCLIVSVKKSPFRKTQVF